MSDLGWKHLTPSDKEEILREVGTRSTFYYQPDVPFLRSFNRLLG